MEEQQTPLDVLVHEFNSDDYVFYSVTNLQTSPEVALAMIESWQGVKVGEYMYKDNPELWFIAVPNNIDIPICVTEKPVHDNDNVFTCQEITTIEKSWVVDCFSWAQSIPEERSIFRINSDLKPIDPF